MTYSERVTSQISAPIISENMRLPSVHLRMDASLGGGGGAARLSCSGCRRRRTRCVVDAANVARNSSTSSSLPRRIMCGCMPSCLAAEAVARQWLDCIPPMVMTASADCSSASASKNSSLRSLFPPATHAVSSSLLICKLSGTPHQARSKSCMGVGRAAMSGTRVRGGWLLAVHHAGGEYGWHRADMRRKKYMIWFGTQGGIKTPNKSKNKKQHKPPNNAQRKIGWTCGELRPLFPDSKKHKADPVGLVGLVWKHRFDLLGLSENFFCIKWGFIRYQVCLPGTECSSGSPSRQVARITLFTRSSAPS